jgi:hypothetical protein
MRRRSARARQAERLWLLVLLGATVAWGQGSSPAGAPFARGEVLNYSVNWPSGLSLGEAQFKVGGGEPGWKFEFSLDASLPGFEIKERYQSTAGGQFCSEILEKEFVRGVRKGREKVTYDQKKRVAERQTLGGGRSEVSVPECVKDGLTFLFFLRRELAAGRVPPAQTVNLGAAYQVTASYADSPQLEVSGTRQTTDRVLVSFRGPASSHTIEMFFARDAARTPVLVRAPFSLGTFALELVR